MDLTGSARGEDRRGVSAILLFIFMFFDWFTVEVSGGGGLHAGGSVGGNAWDALRLDPDLS